MLILFVFLYLILNPCFLLLFLIKYFFLKVLLGFLLIPIFNLKSLFLSIVIHFYTFLVIVLVRLFVKLFQDISFIDHYFILLIFRLFTHNLISLILGELMLLLKFVLGYLFVFFLEPQGL